MSQNGCSNTKDRGRAIAIENPEEPAVTSTSGEATAEEAEFEARVDKLLASALEEEEREQQAFMRVLQSSRDALTAVRTELDVLRGVIEGREQAVVDLLDSRLATAAGAEAVASMQQRIEELEGSFTEHAQAVVEHLDTVTRRTQTAASSNEATLRALGESLEARQQEIAESILKALDPIGRIMQVVQSRLARAASELAVAQGSLFR